MATYHIYEVGVGGRGGGGRGGGREGGSDCGVGVSVGGKE